MPTINDLPNEILIEIFSYVNIQKRQSFATVCKKWDSLIKSMWRTESRLVLHNRESAEFSPSENCLTIFSKNSSNMEKVLKKFDGKLKKLRLFICFILIKWYEEEKMHWSRFCDELQTNKQLSTVKLQLYAGTADELIANLMQSLPAENLRNLSISGILLPKRGETIAAIETILRKASTLKYLFMEKYTLSMVEIIDKIKSLESLHLIFCTDFLTLSFSPSHMTNFSNLKELTLLNGQLVTEQFLEELCNKCKTLIALTVNCRSVTQRGFNAIGQLWNLNYLNIMMNQPFDYEVLYQLLNLEELYLKYDVIHGNHTSRLQLQRIFHRLPRLKHGWFDDDILHTIMKPEIIKNQFHLEPTQNFHLDRWNRIFNRAADCS